MVLYVAAKPGKGVRTWAVGLEAPLKPDDAARIEEKTRAVAFPTVHAAIAFSLVYPRKGTGIPGGTTPMPEEWREATRKAGRELAIPDELLLHVWP